MDRGVEGQKDHGMGQHSRHLRTGSLSFYCPALDASCMTPGSLSPRPLTVPSRLHPGTKPPKAPPRGSPSLCQLSASPGPVFLAGAQWVFVKYTKVAEPVTPGICSGRLFRQSLKCGEKVPLWETATADPEKLVASRQTRNSWGQGLWLTSESPKPSSLPGT